MYLFFFQIKNMNNIYLPNYNLFWFFAKLLLGYPFFNVDFEIASYSFRSTYSPLATVSHFFFGILIIFGTQKLILHDTHIDWHFMKVRYKNLGLRISNSMVSGTKKTMFVWKNYCRISEINASRI